MKTYNRGLLALVILITAFSLTAKPIIGLTVDISGDDPNGGRISIGAQYIDAITSAGGIPLILPPGLDLTAIPRYVDLCDGFVFTGGRDISPHRYNATSVSLHTNLLNPRREQFDFAMIDAALAANKPLLGVCLGSQQLNVALGGSMIQDLPSETSSTIDHKPQTHGDLAHAIEITTGTRLFDLLGTSTLMVNSIHHQACDRLGSGVLVMARAPDGVIESFEVENQDFAMAVQWHPELLTDIPEHQKIYQALVDAAERSSRARQ